jgi:hypothetical protein
MSTTENMHGATSSRELGRVPSKWINPTPHFVIVKDLKPTTDVRV